MICFYPSCRRVTQTLHDIYINQECTVLPNISLASLGAWSSGALAGRLYCSEQSYISRMYHTAVHVLLNDKTFTLTTFVFAAAIAAGAATSN